MTAAAVAYLRHAHYIRAHEVQVGDVMREGTVIELREPPRSLIGYVSIVTKGPWGRVVTDTMLRDSWVALLAIVSPSDRGIPPWDVR